MEKVKQKAEKEYEKAELNFKKVKDQLEMGATSALSNSSGNLSFHSSPTSSSSASPNNSVTSTSPASSIATFPSLGSLYPSSPASSSSASSGLVSSSALWAKWDGASSVYVQSKSNLFRAESQVKNTLMLQKDTQEKYEAMEKKHQETSLSLEEVKKHYFQALEQKQLLLQQQQQAEKK
jgi:hypothetical protein